MPEEKNINQLQTEEQEDILDDGLLLNCKGSPVMEENLPPGCEEYPMIPLRGMIIFPYSAVHLDVGRAKSIQALDEAMLTRRQIFFTLQKDVQSDEPEIGDLYQVGTVASIKQVLKLPGGTVRLLIAGQCRARLEFYSQLEPYAVAVVRELPDKVPKAKKDKLQLEALKRRLREAFVSFAALNKKYPPEAANHINGLENPGELADTVASYLFLPLEERQKLLETSDIAERMELLLGIIAKETEILELERKIGNRVHNQLDKNQKEYYLREQLRAINRELGDGEDRSGEIDEYRQRMEGRNLPEYVQERLEKEFSRLRHMPSMTAEANVVENYIDWVLDMPWGEYTTDNLDLAGAEQVLNEDHYGLKKVKERILEFLAVRQMTNSLKGPILCLVGPPGVGKTSLAASIARALGRKYVRLSLGGVHDEAEIRGHRRTYVGSQPGRIMQYLKNAGSANPLFLLDEIDKMASDFRGDPASAMLEVLDPAQNNNFSDHYLEMPFDLSQVLFITTANVEQDIPQPLWDRMEVVRLDSYTEDEKMQIALRHLLPRQLVEHGLKKGQLKISENALLAIIRTYTREAGVRGLERQLAKICRKVVKGIVGGQWAKLRVSQWNLKELLGEPPYHYDLIDKTDQVGVVNGLAWTAAGGDTLTVEAQLLPGKGNLLLTGQLGDVMKESAQAGWTYLRSIGAEYSVPEDISNLDVHIHVPEGAIPKDGPSAGVTMACALASAFSGRPVRRSVAMTGEITLRGRVLPIGGLKEKSIAALRAGVKTVIIPQGNKRDLAELPQVVQDNLKFVCVETLQDVLHVALGDKEESPTEETKTTRKRTTKEKNIKEKNTKEKNPKTTRKRTAKEKNTETKETKTTETKNKERKTTERKTRRRKNTETQTTESQNTENQDTEIQNAEIQNIEKQNIESQTTESQNTESQNIESQNTESQNTERQNNED